MLDVTFRENASRKRAGNAAQNLSRTTRIALNLPKYNKTSRLGMKGKRLKKLIGIRPTSYHYSGALFDASALL